jgi:hypothetical protein
MSALIEREACQQNISQLHSRFIETLMPAGAVAGHALLRLTTLTDDQES